MSKLNIRDLFSAAKDASVEAQPEPTTKIAVNAVEQLTGEDKIEIIKNGGNSVEIPQFFSEISTVSLFSGSEPGAGRTVAAGGPFLCLARGEGLWVIDMTSGQSNDRSVEINVRPITDMELGTSLLVFTDGIDVAVVKISSLNGTVNLMGSVYLRNVGSEQDPVISVRWHPSTPSFFVTIRAQTGWTLFDLVRLQSKSELVDLLGSGARVPSVFKSVVENPSAVAESTYAWSSASNVIAGKKLSPGVLAILKRGEVSPENRSRTAPSEFRAFSFSADGSLALAGLSDGFKAWAVGHRCSSVSYVSLNVGEEDMRTITSGGEIRAICGLGKDKFVIMGEEAVFTVIVENHNIRLINTNAFSNLRLTAMSVIRSSGLRVVSAQLPDQSSVQLVLDDKQIAVSSMPEKKVYCLVTVPTVGDPNHVAIYAAGSGLDQGTMWTAQTIDLVGWSTQVPEALESNEDEDFPRSDSSDSAPERLESAVTLNAKTAGGIGANEIQKMKAEMIPALTGVVSASLHPVHEKWQTQQRELQSWMDRETRKIEVAIDRAVREQFANGFRKAMEEIGNQIEARLVGKLDAIIDEVAKSGSQDLMIQQLDELIAKTESAIERIGARAAGSAVAEPPALAEIRRYINGGDHLQAISTATQWWKLNQPVVQGQADLLAITCAAIAPQIRQGEPMRDIVSGCYMLLVLTEWTKLNSGSHADRTVAVLRAAKYVLSCLFASPINVAGETMDLSYKSLSKSVRNAAGTLGNGDRTVEELSRELLSDIREYLMRFTSSSRTSTPRGAAVAVQPGANILQMLQHGARRN